MPPRTGTVPPCTNVCETRVGLAVSTAAARILVVDDDDHLREVVRYALAREGFAITEARDGEAARRLIAQHPEGFELLVLDVAMPKLDGFSLCRELRATSGVPVLFLSARNDEIDRVLGLDLGGDDYLGKPFSPRELVSRVKALLRRARPAAPASVLVWGRLRVDTSEHRVFVDEREVELTATELRLLAALLRRPHRALAREELAAAAYDDGRAVSERTVDSHVRRVRAKLRPFGIDPFETVHGVGFRLGAAP
ncbi:MAG: response regulator transcription factor [Deltaproteobacteria bacterium]|nr:response regulator transcription factor [Nannocystaceae bacterium]